MSLFQTDGFIEKFTRIKETFSEEENCQNIVFTRVYGISRNYDMKCLNVNTLTVQSLLDELLEEEIIRYNHKNSDTSYRYSKRLPSFLQGWRATGKIMGNR